MYDVYKNTDKQQSTLADCVHIDDINMRGKYA